MTFTLGLVGCASQKLKRPAEAQDLYVSQLFKLKRRYVEAWCDQWMILSALHGALEPETVVEPYDLRLGTKDAPPIHDWAARTGAQVGELAQEQPTRVIVLAGDIYRTVLGYLPFRCKPENPLKHMGIGEQIRWLSEHTDVDHLLAQPAYHERLGV